MANEKRLIDANAITNDIGLYLAENAYLNDTALDALLMVADWITNAPTVDAVEVVRRKNCAFYEENEAAHTTLCRRGLERLFARPDGFCSYGERRTDNG